MECEVGEAGQLAGIDGVDPGRERGAEAVGEDLAEVADMPGGGIQLRAAGHEAALRRIAGTPAVLKGQLEHLLTLAKRPNITVQLLEFAAGFHPGLYGSFMLMGFPEPNPDVVWVENLTNSVYFDSSADVERYTEVFDHLRARALGPPETRARLGTMIKEL